MLFVLSAAALLPSHVTPHRTYRIAHHHTTLLSITPYSLSITITPYTATTAHHRTSQEKLAAKQGALATEMGGDGDDERTQQQRAEYVGHLSPSPLSYTYPSPLSLTSLSPRTQQQRAEYVGHLSPLPLSYTSLSPLSHLSLTSP